ncbi:hypothetical protein EXIGLDRAFT_483168 [Exidia glandulosa HHB12029]|uniref:Uncharacterized protein n=1 Tax=Exidia glandulosa HHB12029 TaxID=1314781 RepID=A0A165PII2_EXIGL|nr:hypothetical protein EXIGLDRAFT_483168 [Exidia glandulosa HHB12029]
MSGVATAGRREGSTCARCGRPARLAAITNTIGAPTLKRGDVASGMCRCPVVDVSINAGGVAAVLHVTSPRASDEDSDIHGTSRVRAHGPPTPTKATSSPHGKKRRAEDALDVEEVNAAVTPRKKAKLDNTTSHLSPYQGTQLSVKSPRHILTSHASVKSPRSPRARPSTPRTPATSRAKPKPKTTTPRTELTAAVPLDLQPLGRHNDQRTSMPTSSTFTVRSPTYGSRALLGRECTLSARPLYEHLLTSSDSDISRRTVSTGRWRDVTALTSSPAWTLPSLRRHRRARSSARPAHGASRRAAPQRRRAAPSSRLAPHWALPARPARARRPRKGSCDVGLLAILAVVSTGRV